MVLRRRSITALFVLCGNEAARTADHHWTLLPPARRYSGNTSLCGRPRHERFIQSMIHETFREDDFMSSGPDHTRRWLINASSAAILANAVAGGSVRAQVSAGRGVKAAAEVEDAAVDQPISPI